MDIDKDEIAAELDHHRKMLKELRRRLRERELQEVQYGISVPPEITSDIYKINERIQQHESEITRLQTLAAEDKEPLVEAEYRALLAQTWDTLLGRPTVAGAARLERERLRLGLRSERAQELERETQIALATEAIHEMFYKLDILNGSQLIPDKERLTVYLRLRELLAKAISLDYDTTLQLLSNDQWTSKFQQYKHFLPQDGEIFYRFFEHLKIVLATRRPPAKPEGSDFIDSSSNA
jgi:hypothetical protein